MNLGRGSTFRFVSGLALAIVVALVGIYLLWLHNLRQLIHVRREQLHAAGVPRRLAEFAPPPVRDRDNAVILYYRASDEIQLSKDDRADLYAFLDDHPRGSREKYREFASQVVARNDNAFRQLALGAAKPRFRMPYNWNVGDPARLQARPLRMTNCVLLLCARAVVAADSGRLDDACESVRVGWRALTQVSSDATLSFCLARPEGNELLDALQHVLQAGDPTASTCRSLFQLLQAPDWRAARRKELQWEAWLMLEVFDTLEQDPAKIEARMGEDVDHPRLARLYFSPMAEFLRLRDQLTSLEAYQEMLSLANKPYREVAARYGKLDATRGEAPAYYHITHWDYEIDAQEARYCEEWSAHRGALQVARALKA